MKFPGFIGGSYRTRSKSFDTQRTINLYPEVSKSGTSKNIAALIGTPGLRLWLNFPGGNIRGMIRFNADLSVVVSGPNVYKVTASKTVTLLGTIDAGTTPASMASNGTTIMIVTGAYGYFLNPITNALSTIVDADFIGADTVQFIDGYFAFNKKGTGQFQITQLYGTGIDGLDFATAEGAPDLLLSLLVDHREIWLFGETSTEVFFNSGNPDFPFERIQGAFIEQGCGAKFSPAKLDNTVYWLSADERGQGMVQRAQGYQSQRVSTHAVEYAIGQYSTISDAIGYTYQQEGHSFYVLNFPTANATWVYDTSADEWHERAWRNPDDASLNRHRSNNQIAFAGENLVGDWENGNVYVLDLDTYTDNGDLIPAIRQTPYAAANNEWMFFNRLWIDMEVGVGTVTGQGSDPEVMLSWSDDGGNTWPIEVRSKMGKLGERMSRVIFRRLGKSRSRVFRVTITDPVKRVLINADVTVGVGKS